MILLPDKKLFKQTPTIHLFYRVPCNKQYTLPDAFLDNLKIIKIIKMTYKTNPVCLVPCYKHFYAYNNVVELPNGILQFIQHELINDYIKETWITS